MDTAETRNRIGRVAGALLLSAGATLTPLSNAAAFAVAESTFDSSAESWTGLACLNPGLCAFGNVALPVQHLADGGNPGGYIRARDPGSSTAGRLLPPASFSSSFALGQTLSFDVRVERNGGDGEYGAGTQASGAPLVAVESGFLTLVFGSNDFPVIDGGWKHYDVPFADGPGWMVFDGNLGQLRALAPGEFDTAFTGMTRLTIVAEWLDDSQDLDTGGLDNVRLSAVPVPAALPLALSAFGLLAAFRRARS